VYKDDIFNTNHKQKYIYIKKKLGLHQGSNPLDLSSLLPDALFIALTGPFYIETINGYVSTKYFIDKMNYVSRCEPVYSKKSDLLPNNY